MLVQMNITLRKLCYVCIFSSHTSKLRKRKADKNSLSALKKTIYYLKSKVMIYRTNCFT